VALIGGFDKSLRCQGNGGMGMTSLSDHQILIGRRLGPYDAMFTLWAFLRISEQTSKWPHMNWL